MGRVRTKGGTAGFAGTVGVSIVATNLRRIGIVLIEQTRKQL